MVLNITASMEMGWDCAAEGHKWRATTPLPFSCENPAAWLSSLGNHGFSMSVMILVLDYNMLGSGQCLHICI